MERKAALQRSLFSKHHMAFSAHENLIFKEVIEVERDTMAESKSRARPSVATPRICRKLYRDADRKRQALRKKEHEKQKKLTFTPKIYSRRPRTAPSSPASRVFERLYRNERQPYMWMKEGEEEEDLAPRSSQKRRPTTKKQHNRQKQHDEEETSMRRRMMRRRRRRNSSKIPRVASLQLPEHKQPGYRNINAKFSQHEQRTSLLPKILIDPRRARAEMPRYLWPL